MKYSLKEGLATVVRQCFFLSLLLAFSLFASAQVSPQEGKAVNYRIIGFSVPADQAAVNYKIEIAPGRYYNEDSFQRNIQVSETSKTSRIVAEVPSFGKQYTWRCTTTDGRSKTNKSPLHHFSTQMAGDVNPDSVRLRVTQEASTCRDCYVFIDGNKVLYDMKGNPVWFFPAIDTFTRSTMHLRDAKVSPFGTMTTIISERIFEIDYDGQVLWERPGKNKITNDSISFEVYHHDLTRLKNGHYMAMAFEQVWLKLPGAVDSGTFANVRNSIRRDSNNTYSQKMTFGTLVEYDKEGNLVWKWRGSDYFRESDLYKRITASGVFGFRDSHTNSFYFDEKNKTICIGFRDLSRLIEIKYPSGQVIGTYGKRYDPASGSDPSLANGLFCDQHSGRLTDEGDVYLYNNNICHSKASPKVLVLKKRRSETGELEKVWEFDCPIDDSDVNRSTKVLFYFGGNVNELPDRSFFVCMGGIIGKTFIVSRDKKMLWCAQPEKWNNATGKWSREGVMLETKNPEGVYRASIMTRKELEGFIWGSGK